MRCHPRKRAGRATDDPGPRPGILEHPEVRQESWGVPEARRSGPTRRASVEEDEDGGLITGLATGRSVLLRGGGHGMPGADAWLEHSEEGTRGFFDAKPGSQ